MFDPQSDLLVSSLICQYCLKVLAKYADELGSHQVYHSSLL